jgi:hypothetical protein
LFTEPVTFLGTGNGNIFELTLHVHDPANDQLSPVSAEGNYGYGIDNCKYCLLIMRTFWVTNERTMNFVFFITVRVKKFISKLAFYPQNYALLRLLTHGIKKVGAFDLFPKHSKKTT